MALDDAQEKCEAAGQTATIHDLAVMYMERHAKINKKTRSVDMDQRLLGTVILPTLAAVEVAAVTRGDIERLHHGLREYPVKANRVLALLSKMFNLAEAWDLRPKGSNPVKGINRYPETGREWTLSKDDFARFCRILDDPEAIGRVLPTLPLAIKLLLILGCHQKAVLALKWDQVKLEEGYILLGDTRGEARWLALSQAAMEALKAAPRREGNPFVCWGKKNGRQLADVKKYFGKVAKKAGVGANLRIQDLRHIATTHSQWLALISTSERRSQPPR
ncbi:MAG: hypothetical protein HY910_00135 [Desulfarculus sp.]|nr:hypothetical protein [Desulfarculus sp.]